MSDELKETEARIDRLLAWIKAEKSFPKFELNPPAKDDQLAEVEALIGRVLPADVKALYRRFNGEAFGKELGIFFGHPLEPLDQVIRTWLIHWDNDDQGYNLPVSEKVKNGSVDAETIQSLPPFLSVISDYGGSYVGIDLDPKDGGNWGQVVILERDYDPDFGPKRQVVAASLTAFLGWIVEALESKLFFDQGLKEEIAADFEDGNGEPLDESPWTIAGIAIEHLHQTLYDELKKGKLLGPSTPISPFDFPTDALLKASSPVRPDPGYPDGIARTGDRPWTPRPTPRAMRAAHVSDGSLPMKVQALVDAYRETRRRFVDGPFRIELIGIAEFWSESIGQLVAPGIV
jgi:cell wall assembly regulator SMI1